MNLKLFIGGIGSSVLFGAFLYGFSYALSEPTSSWHIFGDFVVSGFGAVVTVIVSLVLFGRALKL